MNKIFQIAKWEFIERVKRKYFIVSTLLTPLLVIAIGYFSGLANISTSDSPQIIGIYNTSELPFENLKDTFEGTKLSDGQPKYIPINLNKDVRENYGDLSLLARIVESGEVSASLIIRRNDSNKLTTKLISKYPLQNTELLLLENIISKAATRQTKIIDDVKIESITTSEIFKNRSEAEIVSQFFESFVLLILLIVTILFSGGLFVRGLAEEKSNRIIEILLSSCKVKDILLGKIFGLSILGMFQISVWIIFGYIFLGKQLFQHETSFLSLQIAYFILGYLFYTSIFVGLGSLVNSEYDSQQLTTNISIFLLLPIILALQIIEHPDSIMAIALSVFPLTSAPIMLLRLNTTIIPSWQILASIISLILFTGFFIYFTAKVFGKGLLMFGKRLPYFKLFKWLRSE